MSGFENYTRDTSEIERELVRKGIALGIDWTDELAVKALAREAVEHLADSVKVAASGSPDQRLMTRIDLFGLAGIMLRTMEKSAGQGMESHGGEAWKAFAKALWAESESGK